MKGGEHVLSKKGLAGHLWWARFLPCMLDERSAFEEIRFIENRPVRAGLAARAEDYPWSSARHHVLDEADPIVRNGCLLKGQIRDWRAFLESGGDEPILLRNWQSLKTGRPAGDEVFVRGLEGIMGRRLQALPRGRPRKLTSA